VCRNELGLGVMYCSQPVQHRDQWCAFVKRVMNIPVNKMRRIAGAGSWLFMLFELEFNTK
jgi:hypothetical protein